MLARRELPGWYSRSQRCALLQVALVATWLAKYLPNRRTVDTKQICDIYIYIYWFYITVLITQCYFDHVFFSQCLTLRWICYWTTHFDSSQFLNPVILSLSIWSKHHLSPNKLLEDINVFFVWLASAVEINISELTKVEYWKMLFFKMASRTAVRYLL